MIKVTMCECIVFEQIKVSHESIGPSMGKDDTVINKHNGSEQS